MALDRFLRQVEAVADLAVHEALRNELEDFDLTRGRKMLRLRAGLAGGKLDQVRCRIAPRRHRLEATGVLAVPSQDLLALSSVHAGGIGAARGLL
jgi:hypothetical protein